MSAILALAGITTQCAAQSNLIQTLSVNLTLYNQTSSTDTSSTAQLIRVNTKDLIQLFVGTNVPKGQLLLVTPPGNPPGTTGNLGATLRVMSGNTDIVDIPLLTGFDLFQNVAVVNVKGTHITSYAYNHFSFAFGNFAAEVLGYATWNIVEKTVDGIDLSGSGAFSAAVNGQATITGVTQTDVPAQGTITAGAPKPGP